jgi:putative ABC transport system permease protein
LINVFGLSLSLAFVILIGLYSFKEYGTDKMHSKADRIYVLGEEMEGTSYYTGGNTYIQRYIKSRYPEVESSCAVASQNSNVMMPSGEMSAAYELCVDSTFYRIFDFRLLEGDRNHVLDAKNYAVVTETFARKMFGNKDPVGQEIELDGKRHLRITGVAADMKNSSIRNADIIARFEDLRNKSMLNPHMNNATGAEIFILAKPHSDIESKTEDMTKYFKTFFWLYQHPDCATGVLLVPLNKLYFSGIQSNSGVTIRGERKLVDILFALGLIILLFSIMNYINLTVAISGNRAKEMAVRRLLGSRRWEIMLKLVAESLLLCIISSVVAVLLSYIFLPYASHLLGTELQIGVLFSPAVLSVMIAFILVIGILAGIIPAFVISKAQPVEIVRGTFRQRIRMTFSKIFIIFQNVVTIIMIAVAIIMISQTRHLIHAPLGFNTKNLIDVDNPAFDTLKFQTFVNELKGLACVSRVTACEGTPKDGGNNETIVYKGKNLSFQILIGDENYMDIFGLKVIQDNNIEDQNGVYVNMAALTGMGLDKNAKAIDIYAGHPSWGSGPKPIRGILADFHLRNILAKEHPLLITIKKKVKYPWDFIVEVQGNPVEAYKAVQKVYKKVFNATLDDDNPFLDQKVAAEYESEKRMSTMVSLFAGIAIIISMLGLIAMSTYFIEQRRKEIALRKVFGSSRSQILKRLIKVFVIYVAVAFVIAVPVIYYIGRSWLSNYNYRISLSPWIFIAAGLFTFLISFVAVYLQSYMAANANPVEGVAENQ